MRVKHFVAATAIIAGSGLCLSAILAQQAAPPQPGTPQVAPDRSSFIRTPKPPAAPRINGPRIYGERTGKPFLYHVPATGDRPMTFSAVGLPAGLTLDANTGMITGRCADAGSHRVKITATNAQGTDSKTLDIVIGDNVTLTPPLGWNSWNFFHGRVNEADVRASADAMVKSGLIDHGWTYVNIDDTWEGQRDAQGRIGTNAKFPDMKALADYVHGKGLKFGIYSSPGPKTCAGYEATYQHEDQDAQTYADWGVDYVKYDWCSYGNIAGGITVQKYAALVPQSADQLKSLEAERQKLQSNRRRTPDENDRLREVRKEISDIEANVDPNQRKQIDLDVLMQPYKQFRTSLDKVDRDIVYSLCQYGMGNVWEWGAQVGGNCWRTTGDISANWRSMSGIGFRQNGHELYAGPGHWNDPDMLEVGNGNLTPDEMYTHTTLWCMLAAPLLIGCDMSKMDDFVVSLFSNDEVLAVDQDSLGKQGYRVKEDGTNEVWVKPLAGGAYAVALFNRGEQPATVSISWPELKLGPKLAVRDLWRQKDLGQQAQLSAAVAPHGAELYRVGPAAA